MREMGTGQLMTSSPPPTPISLSFQSARKQQPEQDTYILPMPKFSH